MAAGHLSAKNACCRDVDNLVLQPRDEARPDIAIQRCAICGSRHITMRADPGQIGVLLSRLGAEPPVPTLGAFGHPSSGHVQVSLSVPVKEG